MPGNTLKHRSSQSEQQLYDLVFMGISSVLIFLVGTDVYPIFLGPGPTTALLGLLTLVPMAALTLLYFGSFLRGAFSVPELSALIALAAFSFLWSYSPGNTIERSVPLIVTSAFALMLASVLSLRSLVLLFAIVGALSMFVSLFAIATVPGARGIPPWEDTWNGIFNHKNGLGMASVLALIFSAGAVSISEGRQRWFFKLSCLAAIVLLIASESRSSQVVALFSIAAFLAGILMKRRALIWAIFYFLFVCLTVTTIVLLFVTGIIDPVFDVLERKPTLSGRIPLWTLVWPKMMEEFWFGYGYAGFWDSTSERVQEIARNPKLRFTPFYSHNGLIETWLNTGFVGVILLFATLVRIFRAGFACLLQQVDRSVLVAAFLVLIAFLLLNITEGSVLSRTNPLWMSFVALSAKLCIISRVARKQPLPRNRGFGATVSGPVARTRSIG